jgi:hypothetical protein
MSPRKQTVDQQDDVDDEDGTVLHRRSADDQEER